MYQHRRRDPMALEAVGEAGHTRASGRGAQVMRPDKRARRGAAPITMAPPPTNATPRANLRRRSGEFCADTEPGRVGLITSVGAEPYRAREAPSGQRGRTAGSRSSCRYRR